MTGKLSWERDGQDWPNRQMSRFVPAAGISWHVQVNDAQPAPLKGARKSGGPAKPVLLMLHGTGASNHSWRDLLPILAPHFVVVAPDLPGHGFTEMPKFEGLSLRGMAAGVHALLAALQLKPDLVVGHSAGAAVLVQMCLDGQLAPRAMIGINGALLPFESSIAPLFSGLAKLLAMNPLIPWAFATQATNGRFIDRMLAETGSRIDARGIALYRKLAGSSGHVSAALRMMAAWDLPRLAAELPGLGTPLQLIVGAKDKTISPEQAFEIRRRLPATGITRLPGLGHLAHEEQPALVADHILDMAKVRPTAPEVAA
jgi:magnesium chelatase accessory protein